MGNSTQEELAYAYEELGMTSLVEKLSTTKTKDEPKKATKRKSQVKNLQTQKSNTFEFGVFNLAIPEHIEEPQDLSKVRTKFIPFGTNNLFPQYLAELKAKI